MKTSVAVLGLSFFYLCVAEVQQLDQQGEEENSTVSNSIEPACTADCDKTGSQESNFQLLGDLEAKLKNAEKQLDDLRRTVQGKNIQ